MQKDGILVLGPRKVARAEAGSEPGLGFLLRESYRGFARDLDARLAEHCITHAQWVLLWFLQRAGTLTPLSLSRSAGIKKASATAGIEALRNRGLISSQRDERDGRKINLRLTPFGEDTMKKLSECAASANRRGLRGLNGREAKLLRDLLKRVATNFELKRD